MKPNKLQVNTDGNFTANFNVTLLTALWKYAYYSDF